MATAQNLTKTFFVALAFAVLAGMVGMYLFEVRKFYFLTRNAQQTDGVVVAKVPDNHMAVRFEYVVEGRSFTSIGRAEDVGRSFVSIRIGEKVPVHYDPADHSASTMGNPSKYLYAGLRGSTFLFMGVILCFAVYAVKVRLSDRSE